MSRSACLVDWAEYLVAMTGGFSGQRGQGAAFELLRAPRYRRIVS